MKKKNNDILISSQIYKEVWDYGERLYGLSQTMKKVKLFVKSKIKQQSAEC